MPHSVMEDVAFFSYRENFHLSWQEAMDEPYEEIERAITIWSLRSERDKLNTGRQRQ